MKYLLILIYSLNVFSQDEVKATKQSLKALIRPLVSGMQDEGPQKMGKFRVDQCERLKVDWMDVVLQKKAAELQYNFKPGCDVEGTLRPELLRPFEAGLNLRNLPPFTRVDTVNRITAILETKPVLDLEMREGKLSGKGSLVRFELDYRIRMNSQDGKTKPEHLGGELRVFEINGKKVRIKEKVLLK